MHATWTDPRELTVDVSPQRRIVGRVAALLSAVFLCLGAGLAAWMFVGRGALGLIGAVLATGVFAAIFVLVLQPHARWALPRRERTALAMGLALVVALALILLGAAAYGAGLCLAALVLGAFQAMR